MEIEAKKEQLVLLLGSNEGNSQFLVENAIRMLEDKLGNKIKESNYYVTEAWGKEDQPSFINKAVLFGTERPAEECLSICLQVEKELGRQRVKSERWGPRLIDIDVIFYGNKVVNTESLVIPHPLMQERNFVLVPLSEILPEFTHPVYNLTVSELLKRSKDNNKVRQL